MLNFIALAIVAYALYRLYVYFRYPEKFEKQKQQARAKLKEDLKKIKNSISDTDDTNDDVSFELNVETFYSNSNNDSFEGWFYEDVYDYIDYKKTFKIKYKDAKGNVTRRTIDMYKIGEIEDGFFILAHCRLRKGNRTFRTDRMLECIDMDTGEVLYDIDTYFSELYYNSDEYEEIKEWRKREEEREIKEEYYEEFMQKYAVLLKVLMYIVRCDGTFNQREKAIIREIFENLENNNDLLTDKMLNRVYKNVDMPTYKSFQNSVSKLLKDESIDIDLIDIAKNIIATQKSVHENEEQLLKYLENKLSNK